VNTSKRILSTVAWTIVGSTFATFVFEGGPKLTWPQIAIQSFATMLFSGPCVALCIFGLPIAAPAAHRRLPRPLDWVAIVGTLVAFGMAGSLAGGMVALAMGLLPRHQSFMTWYAGASKVAVYFTVIFGLSGTFVQELRARLARTTVALRTKERDEADARRLAAEAQLASLEARVDPHFLFNTLNSIAALVRDRPADAERVIEQLSSLLRSSLDRRASLVPLHEELEIVRSYLDIERIRFGNRLRFEIQPLHRDLMPLVPRLSLQTLVENSVKYAVSPARDGALITVVARSSDNRLQLAVEDDGPGFDVTHLPEGHGLQLLKSRLSMTFGDRAALVASSRPGRTVIRLEMPFETVVQPAAIPELPPIVKDRLC
jgi:sensor histidine kinase YesM